MEMSTEIGILLAYALGIFALYVVGYMFLVPIKVLLRLVINSVAGAISILAIKLDRGILGPSYLSEYPFRRYRGDSRGAGGHSSCGVSRCRDIAAGIPFLSIIKNETKPDVRYQK